MFENKKRRLSGANPTGVAIALGLTGLVGALSAMPAVAAETEDPIQTAEVSPVPTPEPSATDDAPTAVTPETPAYTLPACEGDKFIAPTMTLPADDDVISYDWNDISVGPPFDSVPVTVQVYAVLDEGYTWAPEMPDGWRALVGGDSAMFTVKFEDVPCAPNDEPIVPETPVVKLPECVDGELTKPTITLPADGAATYKVLEHEPGRWFEVQARVTDGYSWAHWKFPAGWDFDRGENLATYMVRFDEVSCEPGAEQPEPREELAATGPSDAAVLGGAALLTVAAGVSLIIARRRVMGR